MLFTAVVFAIFCSILEMMAVVKWDLMRQFMVKHAGWGMVFSFLFSVAVGAVFSANGLIAMMTGVVSTAISAVIYNLKLLSIIDKYREHKDEIRNNITHVSKVTWGTVVMLWKIITFPYRAYLACRSVYRRYIAGLHRLAGKMHRQPKVVM